MKYYEELFDFAYPFDKYDTVFCPEFNFGAMENPGCVTFNENSHLLYRASNITAKTYRAYTTLHELSHMWFGNLVTMEWWDGLWLKESFASYMGYYCLMNFSLRADYPESRISYWNYKEYGYQCDERDSSHPVASVIPNTEALDTIYDGITYRKGCSALALLC